MDIISIGIRRTKNRENMWGCNRFLICQQVSAILVISCVGLSSITRAQSDLQSDSSAVVAKLFDQQACWNNGDIDCFMEAYWKSDSLKFIGKDGITYGWQATIDRYKSKYPDQSFMGSLSFNVLALEYLGSNTLMLVGKWDLKRTMGDVGGHFTLIWKRISGEWVIIADHTS
jgi:hypothetical protein